MEAEQLSQRVLWTELLLQISRHPNYAFRLRSDILTKAFSQKTVEPTPYPLLGVQSIVSNVMTTSPWDLLSSELAN